jgi:hypothetical protein
LFSASGHWSLHLYNIARPARDSASIPFRGFGGNFIFRLVTCVSTVLLDSQLIHRELALQKAMRRNDAVVQQGLPAHRFVGEITG